MDEVKPGDSIPNKLIIKESFSSFRCVFSKKYFYLYRRSDKRRIWLMFWSGFSIFLEGPGWAQDARWLYFSKGFRANAFGLLKV